MSKEAAKLMQYLYRVQQGKMESERYSRLLNSSMNMSALHEAAHAVIGVSLGAPVTDAMIVFEVEQCDGGVGVKGGETHFENWGVPTTFTEKVVVAAILLASWLTEKYKFDWLAERHLTGFDDDEMMLERFCGQDEHILVQAEAFLYWAFKQAPIIHRIERVAAALSRDKTINRSDIDRIFLDTDDNGLGGLDFTPRASNRFQEFIPASDLFQRRVEQQPRELKVDRGKVVKAPIATIIGFQLAPNSMMPLRIVSFEGKDEKTGEIHRVVAGPEPALDKFEEFGVRTSPPVLVQS